jgi:hypothetical protein
MVEYVGSMEAERQHVAEYVRSLEDERERLEHEAAMPAAQAAGWRTRLRGGR